jgi:hypothetical protein
LLALGIVAAVLAMASAPALAAIAVDSATSAQGSTASLSWNHTVGSGANRILIVGTSHRDGNRTVDSVTYGGTLLVKIGEQNGPGNGNKTTIWRLIAPPSGTALVVVNLSASSNVAAGAISFTGVDPTTPLGTFVSASGTSTTASVIATSASGELVVDTATVNGDGLSLTVGAGQTQRWNTGTGTAGGDIRGAGGQ